MVDSEIDGSMYGRMDPTIYGSENGDGSNYNNNPSGRIMNSGGRVIEEP